MPYWRSYAIHVSKKQLDDFLRKVRIGIRKEGFYLHENHYPYDKYHNQDVEEIDHLTIRYSSMRKIEKMIEVYSKKGYSIIKQSSKDQSVPEINHFHFIKH